jgi:hypothetical protein
VDAITKLEPPRDEHIRPWRFAVFPDGSFLVTGEVLDEKHFPKEPFTAIFHRSGDFAAPLSLPDDLRPEPPKPTPPASPGQSLQAGPSGEAEPSRPQKPLHFWVGEIQHGIMLGSPDGNVYVLRATSPPRLYAISPEGVVQREVVLKPPDPDMEAIQLSITAQDRLVTRFALMPGPSHPKRGSILALADLLTGRILETYDVPPSTSMRIPACATPQNDFLFLGRSKENHLQVIKYAAR